MGEAYEAAGELLEVEEFFAPSSTDMVDGLIGQYRMARNRVEKVAEIMAGELGGVVSYFIEGNKRERDNWYRLDTLFAQKGAVAALNADYWNRALRLTDVLDCMPQKRREEWSQHIREMTTPDFDEDVVRATLTDLLNMRSAFFAERVDGLFRALSGEHVTNRPEGFGKRMIIANIITSYGTVDFNRCGYINDLRAVIAKFMGREELKHNATDDAIKAARRHNGEWMSVDGGALRIRVYNGVGTAHLEVHPDMAWRLNCVLASLYPLAIPPKFRQKPKRMKEYTLIHRPLPFSVVSTIAAMEVARRRVQHENSYRDHYEPISNTRAFRGFDIDPVIRAEVAKVMEIIGGAETRQGNYTYWQFDYDPSDALDEIICSGCIPDHKSHQFYPTPESVARIAIEMADIEPHHTCLEPSAGQGGLANHMPKAQVCCVEVSPLHCQILRAKGYADVEEADFIEWARTAPRDWDRVVMNPPFSDGRWRLHLDTAAAMVKPGGRLVAVLPASARGNDLLTGWSLEWSGTIVNEFAGTSVAVVILAATRAAA